MSENGRRGGEEERGEERCENRAKETSAIIGKVVPGYLRRSENYTWSENYTYMSPLW